MKAIIMAGGFGTRLRPLTANIPKPMVPMVNKPMMQHIVSLLKNHHIDNIISSLFYQPDAISSYFGNGEKFGVTMNYVRAEADYGTAGSVKNAVVSLGIPNDQILIISGDVLTDVDLTQAIEFHNSKKAKATLILTHANNPLQFGVVITQDDGRISRFLEKPTWGEVFSDTINTGIYILEPEVLKLIPYREEFDFSKDLFPLMLEQKMDLYGYIADCYWRDIGNLYDYQEAHLDFLSGKVNIKTDGTQNNNFVSGEKTVIKTASENISGNNLIGKNSVIDEHAIISNSVIGDHCMIGAGSIIKNSVVWSGSKIGRNSELSADVVGFDCDIQDGVIVGDNVFISDKCIIGNNAKLIANIKLWPEKIVEDSAVVNRSLVLEDRWLKELFTDARVTGLSNLEMNPEFGARLGAALGTYLGVGKIVATSRDSDNVSRMLNRAMICGLLSAGVSVNDLRAMPIPLVRHELSTGNEAAGIHVRKSPYNKAMTDIIFFDSNGRDLPIRKTKSVERIFFGEDFLRAPANKVGSINFAERTSEVYRQKFLSSLNLEAIRKAKFKIVLDYSYGVAATIFPTLLGSFNIQSVALNSHLDPNKLTRDELEISESLKQLAHIVTSLKYDLGIMIDAGSERITIIDELGNILDGERLLTMVVKLFLDVYPNTKRIAVPIVAPSEIDVLSKDCSITKTKNSHLAMMEAAFDKSVAFVGGTKGGFIFTEFFFASDAMYSAAKIIELLAVSGEKFGSLDKNIVKYYSVKRDVMCPWDSKGQVMRHLNKATENADRELVDGVKIKFNTSHQDNISVQIIPDRERPFFHIRTEAHTESAAIRLADEYMEKVIEWRDM
ncbi:MAG: sugar phosphate nucleotidyltransferase [Bacteroidota bacterium]|nr:sugar phosphate nucleotidyltransferase [Bacteroidota bacterium]